MQDVVLVTIDTLRADTPGYAGGGASTPLLDRIAGEGLNFPNAHAHAVLTLPSHASLLSGLLPTQHGVRSNSGFALDDRTRTIAQALRAEGIATGAFVAAFPLDRRFGLAAGFDVYDDRYHGSASIDFAVPERAGDEVVAAAHDWWDQNRGQRRFLWVHLFEPHAPYSPPEPFASTHTDDPYLGEVAAVDAYLRPLLEPILDAREPVLVTVTSDHGEGLGEHGELTHGLFAYEGTLRVPLLLWAPGLEPGVDSRPARHIDLAPTILSALGVDGSADLPGRSLLEPPDSAPATYFESLDAAVSRGWAPLTGVIADGHKYIQLPIPELYDLTTDPGESRNLLQQDGHAARRRAAELRALLPDLDVSGERKAASDAETRALQNLGYLAGSSPLRADYTEDDDPKRLAHLDRMLHEVIDLYQRRQLAEASRLARQIVDQRPDMGVGHYHLSQVLLERGRDAEALEVLEEAQHRGVNTPAGLRQLALLLVRRGRAEESVALLEPLESEGDPDDLNALAVALSETGHQERAREILERVLALDADNPPAHQHMALVALRQRDWRQAETRARRALDADDALPDAWNYLGVALQSQDRPREALAAWERALTLAPNDFDVLFNFGLVAAQSGDPVRARRAFERFVAEAPADRYAEDLPRVQEMLRRLPRGAAGGQVE